MSIHGQFGIARAVLAPISPPHSSNANVFNICEHQLDEPDLRKQSDVVLDSRETRYCAVPPVRSAGHGLQTH